MKLGLLGSMIVADVIFRALARDPVAGEDTATSLKDALKALSINTYKVNHLDKVDEIKSSRVDRICRAEGNSTTGPSLASK